MSVDDKAEMVSLAWKVVHDHRMGLVTYFRVLSGVVRAGAMLVNTSEPDAPKERLNKLVLLKGASGCWFCGCSLTIVVQPPTWSRCRR